MLKLSRFQGRTAKKPESWPLSWPEFISVMGCFDERMNKDGPLVSPAEYLEGATRGVRNVERVHLLGLDLDKVEPDSVADVLMGLDGLDALWHTTWSHAEQARAGLACYRIFIRLDRPVEPKEWRGFWARACARYGCGVVDEAAKDSARIFYLPSTPQGTGHLTDSGSQAGAPLSVDQVLALPEPDQRGKRSTRPTRRVVKRRWDEAEAYQASTHEKAEAKKWLRYRCDELGTTPSKAAIRPRLNEVAFMAGQRVPHLLDADTVKDALWSALRFRRPRMDEPDPSRNDAVTYRQKYEKIINQALRDAHGPDSAPFFGDNLRIGLNEVGVASRVARDHVGELLFVPMWDQWMIYSGRHWVVDYKTVISRRHVIGSLQALRQSLDSMDDESYAKSLGKLASGYLKSSGLKSLLSVMETFDELGCEHTIFDPDPWLLNVSNGIVDLRTGQLEKHRPEDYITKYIPIKYEPKAKAPRWRRFVLECMDGDEALAEYLQRAVGYSLTGSVQEHCLFFLHGHGRNGKTTFINALMDILGGATSDHSYASRGTSSLLLAQRHEGHPTEKVPLFGARVVAVPEVEANRSWSETTLKELTGGEQIMARRMRENFWSFVPTHKFWISGNSKPRVRGTDDGIWSRLKLIPFEVSFKGREDRQLAEKLEAEREGILAWAVEGAMDWMNSGLREPPAVSNAVLEYREDEDVVSQFVAEKLIVDASADKSVLTRSQMRRLWESWISEQGIRDNMSAQAFTGRLRKIGLDECRKAGSRAWKGVRARTGLDK